MKMLTVEERKVLAKAIECNNLDKGLNLRAKQSVDPTEVWKMFSENFKDNKMMKPVKLGIRQIEIYKRAINTVPVKETVNSLPMDINILINKLATKKANLMINKQESKQQEFKLAGIKKLTLKQIREFLPYFDLFKSYGSKAIDLYIRQYANNEKQYEKRLVVVLCHSNVKVWELELPFINNEGFFKFNKNKYCFMYKPKNLEAFLGGYESELKVHHPYETLVYEILKVYTNNEGVDIMLSKDIFDSNIQYSQKGSVRKFQAKINNYIRNAKDFYWEKKSLSPVVWFDDSKSKITEYSYSRNIMTDLSYESMISRGLVPGLDLLTGSTSLPGRRVKIASNYELVREGSDLIVRKVRDLGNEANYIAMDKLVYPAFCRTSAKRQNSATVKDTNSLVTPCKEFKKHFSIKF